MGDARRIADEFVDAFNAHDETRMQQLDRDDVTFTAPGEVSLSGSEATTQYAMSWLRAFPDARMTVVNSVVSEPWAVQEFTFEGTHDGPLVGPAGEIPPTHRQMSGHGVQIMKVEDGKIADVRLYFDQIEVLTQLGVMPAAAAATA
jgi:steroid delta-isomerase-like uncharacterized protein